MAALDELFSILQQQELQPSKLQEEQAQRPFKMTPQFEPQTEQKYTSWLQQLSDKVGFRLNPDEPYYDYRKAYQLGIEPSVNQYDQRLHWPDVTPTGEYLKSPEHPTAWMEKFMQMTGLDPQSNAAQNYGLIPRMGQK